MKFLIVNQKKPGCLFVNYFLGEISIHNAGVSSLHEKYKMTKDTQMSCNNQNLTYLINVDPTLGSKNLQHVLYDEFLGNN